MSTLTVYLHLHLLPLIVALLHIMAAFDPSCVKAIIKLTLEHKDQLGFNEK